MTKTKNTLFLLLTLLLLISLTACIPEPDPKTANISGGVFFDCDQNGDCDSGECGIEDIRIRLYKDHCGGDIFQTVSTNKDGEFEFLALEAGDYCVFPDFKFEMCGYGGNYPTNSISRKASLEEGDKVDLTWFGLTKLQGDP